jgi:hypothetical protein
LFVFVLWGDVLVEVLQGGVNNIALLHSV